MQVGPVFLVPCALNDAGLCQVHHLFLHIQFCHAVNFSLIIRYSINFILVESVHIFDITQPFIDDAEIVIIGFGTAGRVALSAVREARAQGIKVGLLRPVTVSPFPSAVIEQLAGKVDAFLVTEMNSGQMLEDVRLAVKGRVPVEFYGRLGGVVPFPDEILNEIRRMAKSKMAVNANPRDAWLERMAAG